MAIQGIGQPAVIQIDGSLRLRKFDGVYDFAFYPEFIKETIHDLAYPPRHFVTRA